MYLKRIKVYHEGPIDNALITSRFDKNGNPNPIVIVGENGAGKTTLISNIVDSFYEIANKSFSDIMQHKHNGYEYFKAVVPADIHIGEKSMYSFIEYSNSSDCSVDLGYFFKLGKVNKETINNDNFHYSDKLDFSINNNHKQVFAQKEIITQIFNEDVICYFSPDRFEKPVWMGRNYYENSQYEHLSVRQRYENILGKDITVKNTTSDTLVWLLDVIADSRSDVSFNGSNILLAHSNTNDLQLLQISRSNVEKIMSEIIGKDVYFGLNYRSENLNRFKIISKETNNVVVPTLDSLSTGQSAIFNMFATIVRYADATDVNKSISLDKITGIVVIDEIELHLHSNLQREVLPKLLKLFPKVQFIISTHSPLFLLGMDEVFGADGYDIYQMPNAFPISCEMFSEFLRESNYFQQTQAFHQKVNDLIKENQDRPLIITEGATDWKHLKAAYNKICNDEELKAQYENIQFDFLEYESKDSESDSTIKIEMGNGPLLSLCQECAKIPQSRKLIFIADADHDETCKKLGEHDVNFKSWGNNVYSFIIPVPEHRATTPKICIEHYYSDEEIMTPYVINGIERRLFMGNEFYEEGISLSGEYMCTDKNSCGQYKINIIDGGEKKRIYKIADIREKKNVALPKMVFAENILNGVGVFSDFSYKQFTMIFDIIKEILTD